MPWPALARAARISSLVMRLFPDLKRWRESIAARPATQRAYAIAKTINVKPAISDEESRKILFGQGRHTVR